MIFNKKISQQYNSTKKLRKFANHYRASKPMNHISATIITRNEEPRIERCLNSLKGVADEIIVVDSYSTDRTVEICQRYGCKVTQRAFTGFGSQRQYAAGLTTHRYVLSIDADEVLSDQLRAELIALKTSGLTHRVYSMPLINYFCGKPVRHSGWQPVREVRLFNKRYANWNLHELHERITYDELLIPCPLDGRIDHFRVETIDEFERKEQRRGSLRARVIAGRTASIMPLMPHLRATLDYLSCQLRDAAILDGREGNCIALRRFSTTLQAYRIARSLLRNKNR